MSERWTPTREQRDHYDQFGYFIVHNVVDRDTAMEIRGVIKNHILTPDIKPVRRDESDPMDPMGDAPEARAARFRKLGNFCIASPVIWHSVYAGGLLPRIVQHFLGADLVLKYNSCFLKPARTGSATPWHQDNGLWRDGETEPFNFWMAIDPATQRNGCMQFIPQTHREPIEQHGLYRDSIHGELRRERVEACRQRYGLKHIELQPGDVVCWHSSLYHYSPPNTSDQGRIAIAGVYSTPAIADRNPHKKDYQWVMRGGELLECFPPEPYIAKGSPVPQGPYAQFEPLAAV